VSLLFPERLEITLSPAEVTVGGKSIACDEPLAVLQELELPRAAVTVILSNHYVRYALVPWSDALAGEAEEIAYVRHHFARIHGERAKGWSFRATPAPAGAPRLCSAIDTALLEEIKRSFKKKRARLASVQPALMAVFNRARSVVPSGGAWIALVEPDRACVALHAKGRWQSIHNGRGEWLATLDRERHRPAGEVPDVVLLHSRGKVAADAPGWKVERLAA
jgi:hypothetical protein